MKLFIYEKFWDSFLNVNRTIQKKISDFITKFKEDSKSSGIHLEPISTFKDASLRTARVDQKYRAIIKEVEPGNTYLLVWVDNHDEAMNWAKNKMIDWNPTTQSYQIYTIDETKSDDKPEREVTESLFMGKYGKIELEKIGVPTILLPSILSIQGIDELEKIEKYLPADVFENLFYLLDGANLDALITEINEGKSESDNWEDQLLSKNNHRSFIELTDDHILNEALQGSLKKWKYYLHPSQAGLVKKDFKGSAKISGGAGTGKTVAALHRLKYLSENRRSGLPVLFTTFTKELTGNLRDLAAELDIIPNTFVIDNIDSLAFKLAKEKKLIKESDNVFHLSTQRKPTEIWEKVLEVNLSAYDEEFLNTEYESVILDQNINTLPEYLRASRKGRGAPIGRKERAAIWNLTEQFRELTGSSALFYKQEIYNLVAKYLEEQDEVLFSHIIVDELQDFSNVELRFIRSLTNKGENDLFLVGDPLQNIYNKQINFSRLGIEIRGKRSRRLRINYRTTEEIKNVAIKVIRDEDFDDFDGGKEDKHGYLSLFHGEKPEYKIFKDKNKELATVTKEINTLIDEGYQYAEIAISSRSRESLKTFRDFLYKSNIPFTEKNLFNSSIEGVRLATFHNMKGLEFKQVFLVDVNKRTFPKLSFNFPTLSLEDKNMIVKTEKALFYVAASRAIERLIITGIGEKSELLT